jgi:hypothetical protein
MGRPDEEDARGEVNRGGSRRAEQIFGIVYLARVRQGGWPRDLC